MTTLTVLFWACIAAIIYPYVVYPLLVLVRGALFKRPYQCSDKATPHVSLIIAAYNEAESIEAKLKNVSELDYPEAQLEVLIASDGSTDGTNEIVERFEGGRYCLLALPRQGKAAALNAAIARASGDLLVFSDANSMYDRNAIRALVAPFADPSVGGVAGNQTYRKAATAGSADGERSYWNFDQALKHAQSVAGNAISATGAIYAIRKSLFQQVPEGVTDDFVTSTRVIAQGYRLVYAPDAIAYESVAKSSRAEVGRKVRVITRGFRSVWTMRELLNPFRFGFYSLQLFSHKVWRRLVVLPLIALFLVNIFLWNAGDFYRLSLLGQLAFYGLALVGWLGGDSKIALFKSKIFSIPFFFCLVNTCALLAFKNVIVGHKIKLWETQR